MADSWDDRLTMQTLRDVYANLNHAEPAPPPAAAREEALDDLGRALAQAELEDRAGDGALGAAPRLLARGGRRRRRRVVQISVNVAERLQRQAFVAPGIGHRTAST